MKIAVRCIYYLPVRPNFLVVDLPDDEWRKFLNEPDSRVNIIRPYIKRSGPSYITQIAWIPLENLSEEEKNELRDALDEV
ncbi:MAG: hypothetical protein HDS97_07270 [Bacteroidales bacterium]|nr:hypothetical protein [Bacteroidales bacterium]